VTDAARRAADALRGQLANEHDARLAVEAALEQRVREAAGSAAALVHRAALADERAVAAEGRLQEFLELDRQRVASCSDAERGVVALMQVCGLAGLRCACVTAPVREYVLRHAIASQCSAQTIQSTYCMPVMAWATSTYPRALCTSIAAVLCV
jgi:hypothetical protein